jgi:hypothetical protein
MQVSLNELHKLALESARRVYGEVQDAPQAALQLSLQY